MFINCFFEFTLILALISFVLLRPIKTLIDVDKTPQIPRVLAQAASMFCVCGLFLYFNRHSVPLNIDHYFVFSYERNIVKMEVLLTSIISFMNYRIAIHAITRSEDKLKRSFVGYSLLFLLFVFLLISSNHVVVTYILYVLLVLLLFEYFVSEKLLTPADYSKAFLFYSFPLQLILTLIVLIILLQLSLNYDLSYDGLVALVKK